MEHPKFKETRMTCRKAGIKYRIVGVDGALYLLGGGHYKQVCFSLLNLSNEQIEQIVNNFKKEDI